MFFDTARVYNAMLFSLAPEASDVSQVRVAMATMGTQYRQFRRQTTVKFAAISVRRLIRLNRCQFVQTALNDAYGHCLVLVALPPSPPPSSSS